MPAGCWINSRSGASLMQIACGARQGEVLQNRLTTLAFWNCMFDVESGSLKALVHQAILAASIGAHANRAGQIFRHAHYGCLPKICNASPRTSDNCSLNST